MTEKKILPILFSTLLLDTISIGILFPILPVIFTDANSQAFMLQGYSVSSQYFIVGLITALYGFMQFIAAPILGELSDIFGRKKLLTIGVALLALSNLVFGFGIETASLALLFISRIVAGLAGGNFSIAQATIADVSTPENRTKNFGLIGAAFGIGFILGPLIGGFISGFFDDPAAPFWFAGALGIINVIFISTFLSETRKIEKSAASQFDIFKGIKNIKAAMKDKDAAPVYLVSFLYMSGFAFFTSFVSVLLSNKYGFAEEGIGVYFAIFGLFIALTQLVLLGKISKKYSEKKILIFGFPLVALSILLIPFSPSAVVVYSLIPFMAIPQGLAFANISSLVSKSVSSDKQGAALGINGSLMALAQSIVPLIAGIGTGITGLTLPFVTGAFIIVIAWHLLRTSKRIR